jgi:hypothetical protein
MVEFIYHNPPRRKNRKAKKARRAARRVSAKQRANWARFARIAKARAKGRTTSTKRRRRRRSSISRVIVARSTRRATSMPRTRRRSRRRGRRSGAGASAPGFSLNPRQFLRRDVLMEAGGVAVATIAIPKIIEKLGMNADGSVKSILAGANGQLSPTKYMVAKLAAGLALAFAAAKFKQPVAAKGLLVGALAMTAYDLVIRSNPKLAPGGTGGLHGDYLLPPGVQGDYLLPQTPRLAVG